MKGKEKSWKKNGWNVSVRIPYLNIFDRAGGRSTAAPLRRWRSCGRTSIVRVLPIAVGDASAVFHWTVSCHYPIIKKYNLFDMTAKNCQNP